MQRTLEELEKVFPIYLSDVSKMKLAESLRHWDAGQNFHAGDWQGPEQPIQGDGYSTFTLFDFESGDRREVSAIVLSNTCDIDTSNESLRRRNVLFAPIMPLASYRQMLISEKIPASRVEAHIDAVKRQEKSDLFFIPSFGSLPECIAVLDDVHAQPLHDFLGPSKEPRRLFRLSNFGFYFFLMKLSIHLTRFGEKLDRADPAHAAV